MFFFSPFYHFHQFLFYSNNEGTHFSSLMRYNIIDLLAILPLAVRIPVGIATPTKDENAAVHYLLYCLLTLR